MLTNRQLQEIISKSQNEYKQNGNSVQFKKYCYEVTQQGKIDQMINFVRSVKGADVKMFGLFVRTFGNAEQNFEYCFIEGSDTKLHRQVIIDLQDVEFNLRAGKQINDEYREDYVNKHGEIVLKGNAYQNFKYIKANKCKNLNRQAHIDALIKSKNVHINYLCAKEIEGIDILPHGEVVKDSDDVITNLSFAKINGADVAGHLDVVLREGTAYDNLEVLKTFKDCRKSKHINKIFASNDNDVKLECLNWLKQNNLLQKAKKLDLVFDFMEELRNGYITFEEQTKTK